MVIPGFRHLQTIVRFDEEKTLLKRIKTANARGVRRHSVYPKGNFVGTVLSYWLSERKPVPRELAPWVVESCLRSVLSDERLIG